MFIYIYIFYIYLYIIYIYIYIYIYILVLNVKYTLIIKRDISLKQWYFESYESSTEIWTLVEQSWPPFKFGIFDSYFLNQKHHRDLKSCSFTHHNFSQSLRQHFWSEFKTSSFNQILSTAFWTTTIEVKYEQDFVSNSFNLLFLQLSCNHVLSSAGEFTILPTSLQCINSKFYRRSLSQILGRVL